MVLPFDLFDKKQALESQKVLCLNCVEKKEKALKTLKPQLGGLEKREPYLYLNSLKKKKAKKLEELEEIDNKIKVLDGKDYAEIILEIKQEIEKWETRKIFRTLRIEKEYTSELCGCGCDLSWASRQDRPYGTRKFISAEEHRKNKEERREKKKLIREMENKGIDVKVVQKSKVGRSLEHNDKLPEKDLISENKIPDEELK